MLVVYATTHGHTAKVATRLADAARAHGAEVEVRDVTESGDPDPAGHDVVVVAGSLHAGKHQRALVDWVRRHRSLLTEVPTAFLSVSLTAADDAEEARAATQQCIDEFTEQTGWTPARTEAIAGALQYREYDFFTRTLMRVIARRHGQPTDTSHDYDYTDWDAVDRLGRELASAG